MVAGERTSCIAMANTLKFCCFRLALLITIALALTIWALRECNRQAATREQLDRLNEEVKKLWDRSRDGATEAEISMRSRELQDAIFTHRATSPLIFDWVYNLLRKKMEERMNAGAEHWVSELRATGIAH